jgi:16S rRNA processing protein RimM
VGKLDAWIEAGAIVRAHGIRGEVILDVMSDLLDCFVEDSEIRVTDREGTEKLLTIESARAHKGGMIVKFRGCGTRDDALLLRSHTVWLSRDQIGPLEEGRWFVEDVIGLEVYTEEEELLGTLTDVLHMPANDVYVVKGEGGEVLLPVIDDVVKEVDIEGGRMLVHLMEGLR